MSRNLRRLVTIVGAVVVITLGAAAGYLLLGERLFGGGGEELPYRTGVISRGDINQTVSITGTVLAVDRAELTFVQTGTIAEVLVEAGDRVSSGDVLLRLDTTDNEMDISEAELTVELQEIALEMLWASSSAARSASTSFRSY